MGDCLNRNIESLGEVGMVERPELLLSALELSSLRIRDK